MVKKARSWIQFCALLIQNANFKGFATGKIYQGAGKNVCVPGLNCYSCPGAVGACPIGALQNFLSSRPIRFPYYVMGFLLFFGALLGRAVCGFLCPFGFVQELLHKIPFPKKKPEHFRLDRPLRWGKYLVLLLLVIILPMLTAWTPTFCKFLCPAGTLEGGIPLVLLHGAKTNFALGLLFGWKMLVLLAVVIGSVLVFRPFCKYLCPLGAIYGMLNRVSLLRMQHDEQRCVHCGGCTRACPMQADPVRRPNSAECIRCGICVSACPTDALHLGFRERVLPADPSPAGDPVNE
ncbi:MAG: 4Fe-4S binding protein [Oscillospiraceae bacterium]|nr:4Fe-4S binding protein [Oscillospiraceae bacterium]